MEADAALCIPLLSCIHLTEVFFEAEIGLVLFGLSVPRPCKEFSSGAVKSLGYWNDQQYLRHSASMEEPKIKLCLPCNESSQKCFTLEDRDRFHCPVCSSQRRLRGGG